MGKKKESWGEIIVRCGIGYIIGIGIGVLLFLIIGIASQP
jgi:hypothetical protein